MMRTVEPCRIVAAPHQRKPGVGILRRSHLGRHNTHDRKTRIVEIRRAPNHAGIGIKRATPKSIADHNDRRSTDLVFVVCKNAAELWIQSDHLEKISSDARA